MSRARLTPPRGWRDGLVQIGLIAAGYLLYELIAGLNADRVGEAMGNARSIMTLERSLHVFVESDLQAAFLHDPTLLRIANWIYIDGHFIVTSAVLLWVWLRRPDRYSAVRNAFFGAMAVALVGYAALPTAPPRMFPHVGFVDTLRVFSGINEDAGDLSALINPVAAIPSMHIGFALLTAGTVIALSRGRASRVVRALAAVYPLLLLTVVVITANHFWVDAATGAVTAALGVLVARTLARLRPRAWGWPARADAIPQRPWRRAGDRRAPRTGVDRRRPETQSAEGR